MMRHVGYGFMASYHALSFTKFRNLFGQLADDNGLWVGFDRETPL